MRGGPAAGDRVPTWAGSVWLQARGPIMAGLTRDFGQNAVLEVAGI